MDSELPKEATSFETTTSLTKSLQVFDKINLVDSDSEFSEGKHIQIDEASTEDILIDTFDRIMEWF